MSSDPIVTEIQQIREAIAARFNYDVRAIGEDARRRDALGDRKVIRLPPRPPDIAVARPRQPAALPSAET